MSKENDKRTNNIIAKGKQQKDKQYNGQRKRQKDKQYNGQKKNEIRTNYIMAKGQTI